MACSDWKNSSRQIERVGGRLQRCARGYNTAMQITLQELERAINHWRVVHPSRGEERALSVEVNALANVYALMIFQQCDTVSLESIEPQAQQLLADWLQQRAQA